MRVAMELSDRDITFLGELKRIEGDMLQTKDHIPRYEAHMKWEHGFWGTQIDPEIDSVFSKLESYGLVGVYLRLTISTSIPTSRTVTCY